MLVSAMRMYESLFIPWKAPFSIPEFFRGLVPSSTKIKKCKALRGHFRMSVSASVKILEKNISF